MCEDDIDQREQEIILRQDCLQSSEVGHDDVKQNTDMYLLASTFCK